MDICPFMHGNNIDMRKKEERMKKFLSQILNSAVIIFIFLQKPLKYRKVLCNVLAIQVCCSFIEEYLGFFAVYVVLLYTHIKLYVYYI